MLFRCFNRWIDGRAHLAAMLSVITKAIIYMSKCREKKVHMNYECVLVFIMISSCKQSLKSQPVDILLLLLLLFSFIRFFRRSLVRERVSIFLFIHRIAPFCPLSFFNANKFDAFRQNDPFSGTEYDGNNFIIDFLSEIIMKSIHFP